jgi:hypothetical protein
MRRPRRARQEEAQASVDIVRPPRRTTQGSTVPQLHGAARSKRNERSTVSLEVRWHKKSEPPAKSAGPSPRKALGCALGHISGALSTTAAVLPSFRTRMLGSSSIESLKTMMRCGLCGLTTGSSGVLQETVMLAGRLKVVCCTLRHAGPLHINACERGMNSHAVSCAHLSLISVAN